MMKRTLDKLMDDSINDVGKAGKLVKEQNILQIIVTRNTLENVDNYNLI